MRWQLTLEGTAVVICVVGIALTILTLFSGCGGAAAEASEAAYTAALLRCVDGAATLAESKACRAGVNAKYGITETVRDGGAK